MAYRWLADLVLLVHLAFILFVLFGGLLVLRQPRLAWLHLPAAAWGALIEFTGWICPLTPLEVTLRRAGGEAGYRHGFIERYITAAIYPEGLTRGTQVALGVAVVAINGWVYWRMVRRRSLRSRSARPKPGSE
jgi:hypothetical protein